MLGNWHNGLPKPPFKEGPAAPLIGAIAGSAAASYVTTGAILTGGFASASLAASMGVGLQVAGALAGAVVSTIVSGALTSAPEQQDFSSQASGILINQAANDAQIPVIYGSRRVGGTYALPPTVTGDSNEYLNIVLVLGEGEVSAINTVYINDVATSDSRFSGLIDLEKYVGTDTQAASSTLVSRVDGWTTAHQLKGTAYIYIRMKYDADAFATGLPTITADVDGRLLYDPRVASTAFSNNPALIIRDYLTNSRYGRGITSGDIDDTAFIAAANYCEEQVTIGGVTKDRYTANGVLSTDQGTIDNLKRLLTACGGFLVFSGGKYKLVIDKPETAAFTFDEDNILGAWSINLGSKSNQFNRIRANFFNENSKWQPDLAIVDSAALRTQDNELLLEKTIELPFTSDIDRAKMITTINLNQSRQSLTCEFTATIEGLRCEVGDVVKITHSTPAWDEKLFRVMGITLQNNDEVRVIAVEYALDSYDFGTIAVSDSAPNTNLPDPAAKINISDITFKQDAYINGAMGLLEWSADSIFAKDYKVNFVGASDIPASYRQIAIDLNAINYAIWEVSPRSPKRILVTLNLWRGTDISNSDYDGLLEGEYVSFTGTNSELVNTNLFKITLVTKIHLEAGNVAETLRFECWTETDNPATWPSADLTGAGTTLDVGASETDVEGYASADIAHSFTTRDTQLYLQNVDVGEYVVTVVPYSMIGVAGNSQSLHITVPPPPLPEKITGLELDLGGEGEANATEWTGRDVKVKWREASENVGEVDTSGGVSYGGVDNYVKNYFVKVYGPSGFVIRKETVTDTWYNYTYEKNVEDAAKNGDTAYRMLTIKVYARSIHNLLSAEAAVL